MLRVRYTYGITFSVTSVFGFRHVALNVEAGNLDGTVRADGDALLEVTGELAGTVVGHLDFTLIAWLYGRLGIFGNRAAARGNGLIHHQRLVADIGIDERTRHFGLAL